VTRLAALAALALLGAPAPLPNLVEVPPASLEVESAGGHAVLRFTSSVANEGPAALVLVSTRSSPEAPFVTRENGAVVPVTVAYRRSGGHDHFHLVGFERYELLDASGRVVARDHKAGFCLGDRQALGSRPARFVGSCDRGRPFALRVEQGLSAGFADPYDAELGGQQLDVTGLEAGVYVLVNVANPDHALREAAYDDDAAAVRFVLTRPPAPAGIAFVRVLASCRRVRACLTS
jgi:hypothetical protein